ncbi:carboxy-terminal lantibiotic dehydratase [Sesbania bispinosa]|nr:carboxy-terminal lantibiotic dehydratase [Sesbania bispinosa]
MDDAVMLKALWARERKVKAAAATTSVVNLVDEGVNAGAQNQIIPPPNNSQNPSSVAAANPILGSSDKWWSLFNDFEGATSEVGSIFYCQFPIDHIVEEHLNRKEDRARVHKVGTKNIGKKLQSFGAQMAFFGLCVDQYVGSAEKELKNLLLKNKELTEKLKNAEGDIRTVERLKTDLQASEKKNTDLLAEKSTWEEKFSDLEKKNEELKKKGDDLLVENKNLSTKVSTLTTEKESLIAEKDSLTSEVEDVKAQVAMQHMAGFDKAVSQIKFSFPDRKVDEVGAFKHLVDGKLVDIILDEDEE